MASPDAVHGPDFFRTLTERSIQVTFVVDAAGTFTYVSPAVRVVLGYEPEELVGRNAFDHLHPDSREQAIAGMLELSAPEHLRVPWVGAPMAFTIRRKDGSWFTSEVGATNLLDDPAVRGMVCRIHPYDTRRVLDDYLTALATHRTLDEVLDRVAESVDSDIPNGRTTIVWGCGADGFRDVAGATPSPDLAELIRTSSDPALPWVRARATRREVTPPDLAGEPWPAPASVAALGGAGVVTCWAIPVALPPDDRDLACLLVWRDVAGAPMVIHRRALDRAPGLIRLAFERQEQIDTLRHAATHDPLTGAANRTLFFERLDELAGHGSVAVLYLDLDRFKEVNDTHGHDVGDRVLVIVTRRLRSALRSSDLLARLGGDELGVVCAAGTDEAQATKLALRLIEAASLPIEVEGRTVSVGLSVGLSAATEPVAATALVRAADHALYLAKQNGRGTWCSAPPIA